MIGKIENILDELILNQQNLMNIIKIEKDSNKMKELEKDLSKINMIIKSLLSYKNYVKLKEITQGTTQKPATQKTSKKQQL